MSDWGEEISDDDGQKVIDKVVAAYKKRAKDSSVNIQRLNDPAGKQGVYRIQLAFEVGADLVNEFFNTPHGIRGHYYHSPALGDEFTRRCLRALSGEIKSRWNPMEALKIEKVKPPKPLKLDPEEWERIRNLSLAQWRKWFDLSLENGKIWPVEELAETNLVPLFRPEENLKKEWHQYRWLHPEELKHVAEENIKNLEDAIKQLGEAPIFEGFYEQRAILGSKKPLTWKSLDIKGGWIDPLTLTSWTHPSKIYRALQIHYLGFS
ncbi:MAG: hypothetical protein IPM53_11935 [Anaerolineaceae bacterium]|nr:hypothetical protein [Anaerolineaceae bacterium]